MGARVAPEDSGRRRRAPARSRAAADDAPEMVASDVDARARSGDVEGARALVDSYVRSPARSDADCARFAGALATLGQGALSREALLAWALARAPQAPSGLDESSGGPVRVTIEHGAGAEPWGSLDLAQLAQRLDPSQLAAVAPQLAALVPQLIERGQRAARELGVMGGEDAAADADEVGRAAIVARSADPAGVQQAATLALGALAHEPPLDTQLVQQLVQAFQVAYGQGLATDGVYGSATRGALSNILDILPRNLPSLRRDAPYTGPPFAAGPTAPAAAPTAPPTSPAPSAAPAPPAPPPPAPMEAGPPVGPGGATPLTPPSPSATAPTPPVAPPPPASTATPSATPSAPIQPDMTREEAAARSLGPLTACLQLTDTLTALLPSRAAPPDTGSGVGTGTRQTLMPRFASIDALLIEAGAPMLLASRDLDLFNPNLPPVQVMGVDIVGDLAADAASAVADARALGEQQARTASAFAIGHTVGWVTRFRDAFAELVRAVDARIQELRASPGRIGDRVTQLLTQWSAAANQALTDLSATLTGAVVTTAAAGAGFLLVLLLVLWLLASRTPRP